MIEPWELKQDDARDADSIVNFIIFCEDEVSEPIYFQGFQNDKKLKINTIKNQKSKMSNVLKAISYCEKNGLMEFKDGKYAMLSSETQVWCVYDRDVEVSEQQIREGNISFDEAINTAQSKGFKLAWSNDAFELWILLHFEEVELYNENNRKRDTYTDRLNEIFKALSNPNDYLLKALRHPSFHYKRDCKQDRNFRNIVLPEMADKTNVAIERAKQLEQHFASQNIPNHQKVPCTQVHHLVEELLRVGGREI